MASSADPNNTPDSNTKRKADESPEVETPYPRLRRRGSLPDLQDAADPTKKHSLPDLMKRGFMDPEVMKDVAPIICKQLKPSIEAIIKTTIEKSVERSVANSISNVVDCAIRKFKAEVMDPMLKEKDSEIASLKTEIKQRDKTVNGLEKQVCKLSKGMNDLEQYGRRNNIRLNNVPLIDDNECEPTVLDILNEALPDGQTISYADIDRCHPIGKRNKKNNRQVIIKFVCYKTKAQVYDARFNLSNIYMTEDFTPDNQKVVDKLVQFKKAKKIKTFWSYDSKLYAKAHESQPKVRINSIEDIQNMISVAIENGSVEAADTEEDTANNVMQH